MYCKLHRTQTVLSNLKYKIVKTIYKDYFIFGGLYLKTHEDFFLSSNKLRYAKTVVIRTLMIYNVPYILIR